MLRTFAASAALAAALAAAAPASASMLAVSNFKEQTGIPASSEQIRSAWGALNTMGTTEFLGGMVGNFKLDESSMVAGALTMGASEFDRFLRGGALSATSQSLGSSLSSSMASAAGLDLSSEIGSFTSGGGFLGGSGDFASLTNLGGATGADGMCDPEIAAKQAELGKRRVETIVTAGMSSELGFSRMSSIHGGSGAGTGFASMSCLDKLFQNAGSDIMFKPPNLGNLTNQLQNWVCPTMATVEDQIAGAFGNGEIFDTAALGGFFPAMTFGEAMDGAASPRPGMGASASETFGAEFATVRTASAETIQKSAGLGSLFK